MVEDERRETTDWIRRAGAQTHKCISVTSSSLVKQDSLRTATHHRGSSVLVNDSLLSDKEMEMALPVPVQMDLQGADACCCLPRLCRTYPVRSEGRHTKLTGQPDTDPQDSPHGIDTAPKFPPFLVLELFSPREKQNH